ncbi:MAG: neutral/alkaline non-lysosomal ceramidase N-terminal domain-containing protein [Verrucomicrobiales bacterium]
MKIFRLISLLSPLILLGLLVVNAQTRNSAPKSVAPHVSADWKAGLASAVITPDKPIWMAGYAGRDRPAEGKVQDLFAKALALEDEAGTRQVIVTLDLIGVPQGIRRRVAAKAEKEHGLAAEALLINASHTHSGPELRRSPDPPTEEDLQNPKVRDAWEYTVELEEKLAGVIGEALADLSPARLTWNKARCGFSMNRRRDYSLPADHPYAKKAPNPAGPVDQEVPALRVESPEGEARGVLFGYACHNTCLGFYNWCGDYAGFAQEYLEEHRPDFVALFMAGCGGDQNPYPRRSGVVPGVSDLELAQQHGRSLANAVEMAFSTHPIPVTGPLGAAYEEVELAYEKPERKAHQYPVQVIRFGDALTLVALGSEVVVDYSLRLKEELAGEAGVWVAGYSNDYSGYIPSLRIQEEGGYEAATGWARGIEERIVDKVHELHEQLQP